MEGDGCGQWEQSKLWPTAPKWRESSLVRLGIVAEPGFSIETTVGVEQPASSQGSWPWGRTCLRYWKSEYRLSLVLDTRPQVEATDALGFNQYLSRGGGQGTGVRLVWLIGLVQKASRGSFFKPISNTMQYGTVLVTQQLAASHLNATSSSIFFEPYSHSWARKQELSFSHALSFLVCGLSSFSQGVSQKESPAREGYRVDVGYRSIRFLWKGV